MHKYSRLDAAQKSLGHLIASLSLMKQYLPEQSLKNHVAKELQPVAFLWTFD